MKRLFLLSLALFACAPAAARPGEPPAREGYLAGADGTRLFYRAYGRGPDTVVVVHGFQGNNQGYLANDLLRLTRDRVLLFYDQRGGGRSTPVDAPAELGIEAHVRDLEALRQALGIDRLRLLGHSGGAAIATRYALEHPDHVARLVLVSPPPPAGNYREQTLRTFRARLDSATWTRVDALQGSLPSTADPAGACREIVRTVLPCAYFADPAKYRRMRGDFCASPPDRIRTQAARASAFQRSLPQDWRADLRRVAVPVLVIHGDHDAIPVASARAWVEALPDARLLVVHGADHLPWMERPAAVLGAADRFLRGGWPAQAHPTHSAGVTRARPAVSRRDEAHAGRRTPAGEQANAYLHTQCCTVPGETVVCSNTRQS